MIHLLWIHGDLGKGKKTRVMLSPFCFEISASIEQLGSNTAALYFCQSTDDHLNHTTTVLRGLIFYWSFKITDTDIATPPAGHRRQETKPGRSTEHIARPLRIVDSPIDEVEVFEGILIIDAADMCDFECYCF